MQYRRSARFGLAALLGGCVCLSGCGSAPSTHTAATVAYVWGSNYPTFDGGSAQTILEFPTVSPRSTSPIGTLTLPLYCDGGPLATDSLGQLYVACFSPSSAPQILVYPPNPTGTATPLRTIDLSSSYYAIATLAIDANDQLYVGALETSQNNNNVGFAVMVYAQGAISLAVPLRTIQLPTNDGLVDVAVDGTGNIYVAGYPNQAGSGPVSFVNVYSPSATGSAGPVRSIALNYSIYGIAVDRAGRVFVTAGTGSNNSLAAIEEFAPGAAGYASPINSINLSSLPDSPGVTPGGGSVRLDGAGNVFTPLYAGSYPNFSYVLYGFGQTATENAFPIAQSAHNSYNTSFALH